MKIETPQILWNSEGDKGINTALYSIDIVESMRNGNGNHDGDSHLGTNVLATAGNTNIINLWRLSFGNRAVVENISTKKHEGKVFQNQKTIVQSIPTRVNNNNDALDNVNNVDDSSKKNPKKRNEFNGTNDTKIDYVCSLSRYHIDRGAINVVSFSPNGYHLASAGDLGSIVVYSVPLSKRTDATSAKNFWSTITNERDLSAKIINGMNGGICDLSWSQDSKRFMVGTIDHSMFVIEDTNYNSRSKNIQKHDTTHSSNPSNNTAIGDSKGASNSASNFADCSWKVVYRNTTDHTHFIQGVSYDPSGVYLTSMSSDRSVRVFSRKVPLSSKLKVATKNRDQSINNIRNKTNVTQKDEDQQQALPSSDIVTSKIDDNDHALNAIRVRTINKEYEKVVSDVIRDSNFEMNEKSKLIKHLKSLRCTDKKKFVSSGNDNKHHAPLGQDKSDNKGCLNEPSQEKQQETQTTEKIEQLSSDKKTTITVQSQPQGEATCQPQTVVKRHLYADESNLESFFRRLCWTCDGAFLITPCGTLWNYHTDNQSKQPRKNSSSSSQSSASNQPSYATYLFSRHKFDEPIKIFHGLEKPSVVVQPNPRFFRLPEAKHNQSTATQHSDVDVSSNNKNQSNWGSKFLHEYRSVFAVLTLDSVLIYDTYHSHPLCVVRGLHYANYSDCKWSNDGYHLTLCSTDGYVSFIQFTASEIGEIYKPSPLLEIDTSVVESLSLQQESPRTEVISPCAPLCDNEQSATLGEPPLKRLKETTMKTAANDTVDTATQVLPILPTAHISTKYIEKKNSHETQQPKGNGSEAIAVNIDGEDVAKLTLTNIDNGESDHKKHTNDCNVEKNERKKKKKRIQPILISRPLTGGF